MIGKLILSKRRAIWNLLHSRAYKTLKIGDLIKRLEPAKKKELVPKGYAKPEFTQNILQTLRWLIQKEQLKQDVFLIGVPGASRRQLVMTYLELTESEYEYLALTRDVTESDIKQRREVRAGSAVYVDQCAVRAALNGRTLILDGIEKAERNVLPILNNLLENREMQLDDGRFLVAPEKYDKLLKEHSEDELAKKGLVRVDERFRVIALGLPVPKFRGHPLDPPLRSRFQARHITPASFKDCCDRMYALAPNIDPETISRVASFGYGLMAEESKELALPEFPVDNLQLAARVWNINPRLTSEDIIELLYPYTAFLKKEGADNVRSALKTFNIRAEKKSVRDSIVATVGKIEQCDDGIDGSPESIVRLSWNGKPVEFQVPAGISKSKSVDVKTNPNDEYVSNRTHDQVLCEALITHAVGDFCIIGPKGCGKSMLANRFADLLGYHTVPVVLYQDMTSRDLLQQRRMLPNGDTIWKYSPLVEAALGGHLAVLDGIHRLHHSTLNVLQRLVHEREVELFDGTRLVDRERFERIKADGQFSDQDLKERKILPIHSSFRIIALTEPPNLHDSSSGGGQWLTPELLTMFMYHQMRTLTPGEEMNVISTSVPGVSEEIEARLLTFVERLRQSQDSNLQALAASLSTRQLIRIMKRLTKYPDESLRTLIDKACLSRFLPQLTKVALNQSLEQSQITGGRGARLDSSIDCERTDGKLRIGSTTAEVHAHSNPALVPDILFYETPEHLQIMESMLRDFALGEHLLLIGNQGVGKNKIADRFLQLLNRPRQYIQLHRDTTVQTLTLQSTVVDGVVIYDDSPLVKAVKQGHVLVIDEGDKAPTHVTCVLKSLLESGEMYLADGRHIRPSNAAIADGENTIRMHPDFRVIVLANRPGFPFLGNDFYSALGDLFSCHVVDNPSMESELSMLRQYGPNVEEETLEKLARAFSELRDMADQGLLSYPYSTRELVNIVKHLQNYKTDGVPFVIGNVFDFDSYDKDVEETVRKVLSKHGFPVAGHQRKVEVKLAERYSIDSPRKIGQWGVAMAENSMAAESATKKLKLESGVLKLKDPIVCNTTVFPMDRLDCRSERFTEQQAYWQLPLTEVNIISDVAASPASGDIYVASVNPVSIHHINPVGKNGTTFDMHALFSSSIRRAPFKPRIKMAPFGAESQFKNCVLVHEELTNTMLSVDFANRKYSLIDLGLGSIFRKPAEMMSQVVKGLANVQEEPFHRLLAPFVYSKQKAITFEQFGTRISFLDFNVGRTFSLEFPSKLQSCHYVDEGILLVEDTSGRLFKLEFPKDQSSSPSDCTVNPVEWTVQIPESSNPLRTISSTGMHELMLERCLGEKIVAPNRLLTMGDRGDTNTNIHGAISIGFPELTGSGDVYAYVKSTEPLVNLRAPDASRMLAKFVHPYSNTSILPQLGQIVNALPNWRVPEKAAKNRDLNLSQIAGFVEVIDLPNKLATYLPVPSAKFAGMYTNWQCTLMEAAFTMAPYGAEGVVTADSAGGIRLWETSLGALQNSLMAWKRMIGVEQEPIQLTIDKTETDLSKLTEPKHGMVDPTGAPHVGGGMFAGGSGGYNTAGLGGAGGPYRLDIGQTVYQIPEQVKNDVPEHIKAKAREMAKRAYQQRLNEIKMSKYDADAYEKFRKGVEKQITQLRVIIDSLQAKGKERQWVRHQTSGDFDDGKLIEGMTGEKNVYRRRAEKEPEPGGPLMKPKRLRLCVDASGSMYRFNGYDGRMQRSMESTLMLMEALKGYESKFKYDIVGHSGDEVSYTFVDAKSPPKNEKERLDVLKSMLAHSQYCMSGDNTLESTRIAVKELANEDADERFVVVLSDANFDRYGISPAQFAESMTSDDRVNVFAVFIGSLGDQAAKLKRRLPASKAFVCANTADVPQILQSIFTSTIVGGGGSE